MRKLLLLILVLLASQLSAAEKIYNYDIEIALEQDGSMWVTEKIDVQIEGNKIRHGIYRDFPVNYKDKKGLKYKVEFSQVSTLLDGQAVAHSLKARGNSKRLYIGNSNAMAPSGRHLYTLRYKTNYQLGFFADHDELYWNAIGPDWLFEIEKANVKVKLPVDIGAQKITTEYYTGRYGQQGQAARAGSLGNGAWYETTAALPARSGLTVVMSFPKGIIHEPTQSEKIQRQLHDNRALLAGLIGLLVLLSWMFWAWNKVGRDPQAGTIIPRFKAPLGLSPAAVRYVQKMGFDNKAFTAAIISLAVKGHLRIHNPKKKEYKLEKLSQDSKTHSSMQLSPGEQALLSELFNDGASEIELKQSHYKILAKGKQKLSYALKKEYNNKLFKLNGSYVIPAIGITALTVLAMFLLGPPPVWFLIPYIFISLIAIGLFAYLLHAPTYSGRKILDEVEGLKMYLQTAEEDRLNRMRSPELTPEVFETFLPYAFALGVQNEWSKRFKDSLTQALADPTKSSSYHPIWYNGYMGNNMLGQQSFLNTMGDTLGSQFSSAVTHSSTPPGSSSGSGGGGFSGGGGGGGGGGGW